MQSSLRRSITLHNITSSVGGTIAGSAGGTVNLRLADSLSGETFLTTTRTGNGTYSFDWYDNTREVIVTAYETDSLKGASKQAVAGTNDFDIDLAGGGGPSYTEYYF